MFKMIMEINSSSWQNIIKTGASSLGISIEKNVLRQFRTHALELVKWNRRINLTAIDDPYEIAVKHFVDSMAPVPYIASWGRLLDIGSGGGFPGITLKCVLPNLSVLLIDSSRKKTNFQNHMIRMLKLKDIQARHIRAEQLSESDEFMNTFNIITCRAFGTIDRFVALSVPLLAKHGTLIALKGKPGAKEMTGFNRLFEKKENPYPQALLIKNQFSRHFLQYKLPFTNAERTLIILKRIN